MLNSPEFGPRLKASLYLPARSGAWTLHLECAESDDGTAPEVGDVVTVDEPALVGRVARVGVSAGRVRAFIVGGTADWSAPVELRHARETGTTAELGQLQVGVATGGLAADLPFWSRPATTIGDAVRALAEAAGAGGWRVDATGAALLLDPDAATEAVEPGGVEIERDPARGLVTLAPERAVILPGTAVTTPAGTDSVGDVIYDVDGDAPLRCRYYLAAARGSAAGALERLVRALVAREMLYRGAYTAVVQSQSGDLSTVDVLPDDPRVSGAGLQAVSLRHGLPGTQCQVSPGERVLLAWEGGDPRKPYAAVWHAGSAGAFSVQVGGADPVALKPLVEAALLDLLSNVITAAGSITAPGGGPAFVAALTAYQTTLQLTLQVGSTVLASR